LLHRTEDQLRNQQFSGVHKLPVKPKNEEPERRRKKEGTLKDFEDHTSQNKQIEELVDKNFKFSNSNESSTLMDMDLPPTTNIINDSKLGESNIPTSSTNDPQPGGSGIQPTRPTIPGKINKDNEPVFNIEDVKYVSRF